MQKGPARSRFEDVISVRSITALQTAATIRQIPRPPRCQDSSMSDKYTIEFARNNASQRRRSYHTAAESSVQITSKALTAHEDSINGVLLSNATSFSMLEDGEKTNSTKSIRRVYPEAENSCLSLRANSHCGHLRLTLTRQQRSILHERYTSYAFNYSTLP